MSTATVNLNIRQIAKRMGCKFNLGKAQKKAMLQEIASRVRQISDTTANFDLMIDTRPQVWNCSECGKGRQWGFGYSQITDDYLPALKCSDCSAVTRHAFVGLAGMRN
jgi:hypothetical protein